MGGRSLGETVQPGSVDWITFECRSSARAAAIDRAGHIRGQARKAGVSPLAGLLQYLGCIAFCAGRIYHVFQDWTVCLERATRLLCRRHRLRRMVLRHGDDAAQGNQSTGARSDLISTLPPADGSVCIHSPPE